MDYLYITKGISKLTLQEYETLLKYKLIYIGQILISNTGNYKYIINGNEISREEYYYHIHGIISAGNSRPILSENTYNIGFQYFDTTIDKPIWWTGTKWVDATGADV